MSISLAKAASNAMQLCGLSDEMEPLFNKLSCDAVKRIRSADSAENIEVTLSIFNNAAELPLGVILIEAVRFDQGNSTDPTKTPNRPVYPYYRGRDFPLSTGSQNLCQSDLGFDIANNHLVFDSGVGYSSVQVQYMGMKLDADGTPVISDRMELAVQSFCKWQYALIYPEKYNASLIQMYFREWQQTCREARTTIPQKIRVEYIGAMWNTVFIRRLNPSYNNMYYGNR